MSSLTETAAYLIRDIIDALGYGGVLVLMALENSVFPVPSELILCFAGWLVYEGHMRMDAVIAMGTAGSVLGCLLMYYLGMYGGRGAVMRWGRYLHLGESDLDRASEWFRRYGDWAVMLSRLVPILRTVMSIPAGMARMALWRFVLFTTLGTLPYVALLTYVGYLLGPEWPAIFAVIGRFELPAIAAVVLGTLAWFWWKRRRRAQA